MNDRESSSLNQSAGAGLDCYRHACVLYHSEDEEYRVLRSFIGEGFPRGDKAFHIIDRAHRPGHLERLQEIGIDVAATEQSGQLEVRGWEEAHLRPGWFDQHAMLALVGEVLTDAKRRGFPYTRWVADMGWALGGHRGAEDLVEYCGRLNDIAPRHEATIVCTYDLTLFSASSVIDILRSHPVAVIGGMVYENPFYLPLDELLRQLRERRAGPASGRTAAGPV
jgi:hypothetical protein